MTRPPNPSGYPDSLGVIPLKEGEKSRPVRLRAESWVFEELSKLTAAEVGELVTTALRAKTKTTSAPVLPGTPLLFPETPKKPQKTNQKAPKTAEKPKTDQITGNKLTPGQTRVVASLTMAGAVVDYDHHEKKWLAGFAGVTVAHEDLDQLAEQGVLAVTGEGTAAVYRLAKTAGAKLKPAEQLALQHVQNGAIVSRDGAGYVLTMGGMVITTVKRETVRRLVESGRLTAPNRETV